jgi:putative nucleotide binding protein
MAMEERRKEDRKEDYARVLDFMAKGKSFSSRTEPIAQLMGETWFTLLEASTKETVELKLRERVYIGADERDKVSRIKSRITYNELTQTAKGELQSVILEIISLDEPKFLTFFNKAGPLNIREHSLELLPGIGKKHLESILKAREEKPFESMADIANRIPLLQNPSKMIADRIIQELQGSERFYLFTKPPFEKRFPERRY